MKLKLDEDGHAVLQDGKPVYIHDDGKELPFDASSTVAKIGQLNGEAKGHRERAESAEAKLKRYEGIDDPEKARKALETLNNLDQKKLVDAGEVEKLKSEAAKSIEERYKPVVEERDALKQRLNEEMIGGNFARSKFISEKLAIPSDLVQARFGGNFNVEDGKLVAKDGQGNSIYSRANPGELAGFDEAMEILVSSYPHAEAITKSSGATGGGATGGGQGGAEKSVHREAFDQMGQGDRAAFVKGGGKVVD